jgi:chemotaxis protein methyltransferase CheR
MPLSPADFEYVAGFVRREASIVLGPGKEYLVEARLAPVARKAGARDVSEFLTNVRQRPNTTALQAIVDALTTNETSWFRDREPFTALTETVLPGLISARSATRRLRVWSAACSSGQEPYSLAITLKQFLPAGWTFEIVASDISTEMIKRAEAGVFSQVEVNRGLPANALLHNFERDGAHWKVAPALRQSVTFQRLNLAAPLPPIGQFDLVFLRNVLIYFDVETKNDVLNRIAKHLRPDGWLFLGAAETTIGVNDNYERFAVGRAAAYRLRQATLAGVAGKG